MILNFLKFFIFIVFSFLLMINIALSEKVNSIEIDGNQRVSKDTIIMLSEVKKGQDISSDDLNDILKNIYNSNFFETVSVKLSDNVLKINVNELPIIESISYEGIKANKIKDVVFKDLNLKPRSSYNQFFLNADKIKIENALKDLGYYFAKLEINLIELDENKVKLNYRVDLGKKSKIQKLPL